MTDSITAPALAAAVAGLPYWFTAQYEADIRRYFASVNGIDLELARKGAADILAAEGASAPSQENRPGFEAILAVIVAEQRRRAGR